ncbi:MAG: hypothetical protein WCP82_03635 [Alphaproteobacteria bacterium]
MKLWIYYHRDIAQSPRVRLIINWLEGTLDQKANPWFRPEFVHPETFGDTVLRPDSPGRSGRQLRA